MLSSSVDHQVDAIFKAAAQAANMARIPLAKMTVEETGMGVVEDKARGLVNNTPLPASPESLTCVGTTWLTVCGCTDAPSFASAQCRR